MDNGGGIGVHIRWFGLATMEVLVELVRMGTLEGGIGMLEGAMGEVRVLVLEVGTGGGRSQAVSLGRRIRCHSFLI